MSRRRQKRAVVIDVQRAFDTKRLPLPRPYEACKVRCVKITRGRIEWVDVWVEPVTPVDRIDIDLVICHPAADFVTKT